MITVLKRDAVLVATYCISHIRLIGRWIYEFGLLSDPQFMVIKVSANAVLIARPMINGDLCLLSPIPSTDSLA